MTEPTPQPKPTRVPLNKEGLDEARKKHGLSSISAYLRATRDMLPTLQYLVDTATSFEELKKELTALIQDRQEFLDYEKNNPAPVGYRY